METNPSLSIVGQCPLLAVFPSLHTACHLGNFHVNPELITRTDENITKEKKQEREKKVTL